MRDLLRLALLACLLGGGIYATAAPTLENGFANPPDQTKPWCYYYWISDNISKEGITRDLEAMARVGIGEALIGNIFLDEVPPGQIKVLSEEWWQMIEHAIREGGRIGVNIGLFNCPGWSQSGGPWVTPQHTMRYVTFSETLVTGPAALELKLPSPKTDFQDLAVLAFPAPANDQDKLAVRTPRISCLPAVTNAPALTDGNLATKVMLPAGAGKNGTTFTVNIELEEPLTVRTIQVSPADDPFSTQCEVQSEVDGQFRPVRSFTCDWTYQATAVGFIPQAPITVSCDPVTARRFRLVFSQVTHGHRNFVPAHEASLAEINLSGAARLESFIEKQLGKMLPNPFPKGDSYSWPAPAEPTGAGLTVQPDSILDLTRNLSKDGTLRWKAPPGDWVVLRTGMTPTGMSNSPASPEGRGLEIDKMNRQLAQHHFDSFIGQLLKRMPASERKAFTRVVADSYEMGALNWTDGFSRVFQRRYGYQPEPWLPVLTGRIVGSADQSERFLWDLRRLVADQVATEYVGGLRSASRAHGLGLWLENYGHWGFPGEFLKYGSQADRIGGEFWVTGDLGSIECRAAASCANIYNKGFVSAESFTGGPAFQNAPRALKARGDWSFCEGVNHVVLHVYIQQPWADRAPGVNAPWGTEFNRHNTWFERGKSWVDYERRASWMLQQGWRVADALYFIGEDTPKMTGVRQPELPPGYDFDFINADVLLDGLRVRNGVLQLPHGPRYRVLILPPQTTMRPEVLSAVRQLVKDGATVVGPAPDRSPSLQGFPRSDKRVRALAREIWGPTPAASGERSLGKGRVVWGRQLPEVFATAGAPPDLEFQKTSAGSRFLFTHRRSSEADIYFVSNQQDKAGGAECVFRVSGRQPELWDAVTGERRPLADWSVEAGRTRVPLEFAPHQSWFVVFRTPATPPRNRRTNFPAFTSLADLSQEWEATFAAAPLSPKTMAFPSLTDWTLHSEPSIKFYSGKATYRKRFALPNNVRTNVFLNLGEVRDLATVRLNGKELATLWTAPWRVEVSSALKPGENTLEVEIINPWNNRLAGDAALPAGQRTTFLTMPTVTKESPLIPAGLLGPVLLEQAL